jgi:hypothetical protein
MRTKSFLRYTLAVWLMVLVTGSNVLWGQAPNEAPIDDPQVLILLENAQQGDAAAQFLLGFVYAEGMGAAQDYGQAVRWYTKAAEQGHIDAQLMLAMMYAEGQKVVRDPQQAVKWYTTAAGQENADAQILLAEMYTRMPGLPEDSQESWKWMLIAEANTRDVAALKMRLVSRLTADQITEAQKQALAFTARFPQAARGEIDRTIPPGHRVEPQRIPARPEILIAEPDQPSAEPVVLEADEFALQFPAEPKRTVVQNTQRLTAIHYQALSVDGLVQYNASFQHFKDRDFSCPEVQKAFLEEYLVGRAMFAWQNRIQKKFTEFQGQTAAVFKHTTFSGGTETVHQGIIFIAKDNFISLTCVYPAGTKASPSFQGFIESFRILTPMTPEQAEQIDQFEQLASPDL